MCIACALRGAANFLLNFLYLSMLRYLRLIARCKVLGIRCWVITQNLEPKTLNQKFKVVIASGLTSSHSEQRS